jgi:Rod binding domain-containing protein
MMINQEPGTVGAAATPQRNVDHGPDGPKSNVREAAKQFEGILIRQMLAPLEKSLAAAAGGGGSVPMIGGMVMESLSQSIVSGGGLGLAEMVESALRGESPQGGQTAEGGHVVRAHLETENK